MTSQLNVKKIEGLTSGAGNDTVIIRTGNADRVTVTNTAVTMSDNQTVSGNLTVLGNTNISGSIVGDLTVTGNVVTTAVTQTGGSVVAFRGTLVNAVQTNYTTEADMTGYTEDFDLGSNFDHTAGTFTVPQNGVYQINFYIVTDAAGGGAAGIVRLYRDSTEEFVAQHDGGVNDEQTIGASITLNCTANEVFKVSFYASGDTSIALDHVDFSGHLIG